MGIYSKINITLTTLGLLLSLVGVILYTEDGTKKTLGYLGLVLATICILGIVITSLTWLWLEG